MLIVIFCTFEVTPLPCDNCPCFSLFGSPHITTAESMCVCSRCSLLKRPKKETNIFSTLVLFVVNFLFFSLWRLWQVSNHSSWTEPPFLIHPPVGSIWMFIFIHTTGVSLSNSLTHTHEFSQHFRTTNGVIWKLWIFGIICIKFYGNTIYVKTFSLTCQHHSPTGNHQS